MWKWLIVIVLVAALGVTGILIEKPRGGLSGQIYLETYQSGNAKPGYTNKMAENTEPKVVVYGPEVRGVYVSKDGTFHLDGLEAGKYSVRVRANTYASENLWDISVEEGKTAKIKDVYMGFLDPSLNISTDSRIYTSKESPYFWANVSAVNTVKFELYSFDPLKYLAIKTKQFENYVNFLQDNYYYSGDTFLSIVLKDKKPVKTWNKQVNYGLEDYANVPFKVDEKLSAGSYLLKVTATGGKNKTPLEDYCWFSVSDLGIVTKQDSSKLVVNAVNLVTLKQEKDVTLKIYDKDDKLSLVRLVKTAQNGLAEFKMPSKYRESDASFLVVAQKGKNLALGGSHAWYYSSDKYKVYTYTDRPIYRPDHTVYFKGIVRENTVNGIKNYSGKPVNVNIYNDDSELVRIYRFTANAFGTYNGYFKIPETARLGNYRIETLVNGQEYNSYFEVAEYRKPEYKVEVVPGSQVVVGGNKATATIKANYFFGYPVTNAKVKYTVYASPDYSLKWRLMPRPDYYGFYDDWDDDSDYYGEDYNYGSSSGDIIAEGYANTDQNGEAKISFKTGSLSLNSTNLDSWDELMPQEYSVEAEVTDISRKTVAGTGKFSVVSGDFALFADSDSYVYTPDQDVIINLDAVSFDKKPVATEIRLELQNWEWNDTDYTYKQKGVISTATVSTDITGHAIAKFRLPKDLKTQSYQIIASAKDSQGHPISTNTYLWVSNYNQPVAKSEILPSLRITTDKKIYKPGDKAKIMILSPVKNVKALVTMEGSELYSYKLIDIKENSQLIEIPLDSKFVPNAFVAVSLVGSDKNFLTDQKIIKVSPQSNFINLVIKPDKTKYKPRDTVKYTIKATDNSGKPVESEFSFGVVDESIYSIREDFTEDIRKFFYSKKDNLVSTSYSFIKSYSGGPDKIQPLLRKDFKDTAFWNATVKTNKNGTATVVFKVPDNLTTWRTTVRAVTKNTQVASAIDKILVTKDIIVRMASPRFYTVGDKAVLATIVHNYTDKEQRMQLKFNYSDKFKLSDGSKTAETFVTVPPQGQERKDWLIEAISAGEAKFQAYALSSTIEGDALEQLVSILPFGIPETSIKSGILDNDSSNITIDVAIKNQASPGTLKWNVRLAPSNAGMLLGSLDYLIDYPYGCTEQIMSKFMPSIVASRASREFGVSLNPVTEKKLPKVVDQSLAKLYDNQHEDGGWGWWTNDESNVYMTTYVLHGLVYAVQSNYDIDNSRVKKAISWLNNQLSDKEFLKLIDKRYNDDNAYRNMSYHDYDTVDNLAYACYVAALYGIDPVKPMDKLYKIRSKLTNVNLAYLSLAYAELNMTQRASVILDELFKRSDVSLSMVGFGMSDALLSTLGISLPPMYAFNSVETSAIALRSVLKIRPNDPVVDKIALYLSANRTGGYWENTKTTANVVLALSDYIKATSLKDETDYDVVVKLDDKEISRYHFDKSNYFSPETVAEIPQNLISQANKLSIEKSGQGKLYYSSDFSYYQLFDPSAIIPAVENNGAVITKTIHKIASSVDKDGNITYKEVPFSGVAKAGEPVLVKLNIKISSDGQYLLLEDPKSSGMELISTDPRGKMGLDSEDEPYYWWDFWWTHQEDRDSHMAFFITHLGKGSYDVRYLLRPELPGTYLMRPATLNGMYSNGLNARTESQVIKVVE